MPPAPPESGHAGTLLAASQDDSRARRDGIHEVIRLLKQTFRDFSDDHGMRLVAALSYYTMFSLPPLLVLLLLLLGAVLDPADVEEFLTAQMSTGVMSASAPW